MSIDSPSSEKSRSVSPWWRAATIFLALAGLLMWAAGTSMIEQLKSQVQHTQAKLADMPQVRYVAVLLDDQQRPALLITSDPKQGKLQVQRLNDVKEGVKTPCRSGRFAATSLRARWASSPASTRPWKCRSAKTR
ncbi:MAG: hypothetical protein R3E42_05705 [Burkholderiaceae bacterium]